MFNPITAFGAALKSISIIGKTVGKAQKVAQAVLADADHDGTPEYQEALDGLREVCGLLGEAYRAFMRSVLPNVLSIFHAAREAAMTED